MTTVVRSFLHFLYTPIRRP